MLPAPRPFTKKQLADKEFMAEYHKKTNREIRTIMVVFFSLLTFIICGFTWAMYDRQMTHHDLIQPHILAHPDCIQFKHS